MGTLNPQPAMAEPQAGRPETSVEVIPEGASAGTMAGTARQTTRAVALIGPPGTGKTTLAEALLFASGAINRQGSVEGRNTVGDASPEARARGSSTELNLMHLEYMGDRFALLDLPGGTGFAADGLAALQSVDLALIVLDPAPERAGLAEPILRRLDSLGVPHVIFINKIETARAGAVRELIAELQPVSREPLALRQFPIRERDGGSGQVTGYVDIALERAYRYRPGGESERICMPDDIAEREREGRTRLLETLADFDDALLESLLLDEPPDPGIIAHDMAVDTAEGKVVPVVLGSGQTGGGVRRLLKLLRHEVPPPGLAASRLAADDAGGFHVFKIAHGGAMGRLALGRVLGRPLREGDELVMRGNRMRTGSVFFVQGDRTVKQPEAAPGDVVAVAKVDGLRAGDLAGRDGSDGQALEPPRPARSAALAISTRDRKDDVKLSSALHRLCEEDAALEWTQDEATHETILKGINEEHLAVVLGRLDRRYGVAVTSRAPQIAYRESVRKAANQRGRHKKQSGGHGQYGDCVLAIRPLPRGEGFLFEDRITGGAIPKQYIPAVEAGVRDAMARGPLGFPVVDVAVTLTDGSFHAVDSSELAFRLAGKLAMSEALAAAAPYVLEPVCRVIVDTPPGTGSKAGSALTSRRGQILGLGAHPDWPRWERVEAMLPESGLHGLDAELRSLSQGLASYVATFDHLAELSGKQGDEVVKARAAAN